MKKKGSVAEFGCRRDDELLDAYKKALSGTGIVAPNVIYELTADSPSSRFWVSERRAAEVLSAMAKGRSIAGMTPMKREMFADLFIIFSEYRRNFPEASIYEAAFHAVNSPAPRFYLTPKTVRIMIFKIRRERRSRSRS